MDNDLSETPARTPKGKFKAGISGNPSGRPKAYQTTIREKLLIDIDSVLKAVVDAAKTGDMQAAKLVLDRLIPPLKSTSQAVILELPDTASPLDIARAILASTAQGAVAPDIAGQLVTALGTLCRIEEVEDLRDRIAALEKATRPITTTTKKPK